MMQRKPLLPFLISVFTLIPLFAISLFAQNSDSARQTALPPNGSAPQTRDYMSLLELEILDEMNLARTQPQKYADYVAEWKQYYTGKSLTRPGHKPLNTLDGMSALDEAVNFLRAVSPLPALQPAKGLFMAARDHARDLSTTVTTGHRGTDGSLPDDRIERYGDWKSAIGETIVYNLDTPRAMVIQLLIDDGTPTRGHRANVFNAGFKVIGVAVGEPSIYGARCVIDYAAGFSEKSEKSGQPNTRRPANKSLP